MHTYVFMCTLASLCPQAADIVDVKARADEVLSQKVALEDHIQTLKVL